MSYARTALACKPKDYLAISLYEKGQRKKKEKEKETKSITSSCSPLLPEPHHKEYYFTLLKERERRK